jgi:hypothetical protein
VKHFSRPVGAFQGLGPIRADGDIEAAVLPSSVTASSAVVEALVIFFLGVLCGRLVERSPQAAGRERTHAQENSSHARFYCASMRRKPT